MTVTGNVNTTGNGQNYTGEINITIKVNDSLSITGKVNASNGIFSIPIDVDSVGVGDYKILVDGAETDNYVVKSNDTAQLHVTPANVTINDIRVDSIVYGLDGAVVVTGTIASNIAAGFGVNYTGLVDVLIVGTNFNNTVTVNNDGSFEVSISLANALAAGNYSINVTVKGNDNYTGANKTFVGNLTVSQTNVIINPISVESVVYGVDDTVVVTGTVASNIAAGFGVNYTGLVDVLIVGTNFNKTVNVYENGTFVAVISLSDALDVGKYNVSVDVLGNNNYTSVNRTFADNLTVTQANVIINPIRVESVVYGLDDTVVVTGTITSSIGFGVNYTGIVGVNIIDGNGIIIGNTSNVDDGSFSVIIKLSKSLAAGNYTLNVTVEGDNNYAGADRTFVGNLTVIPTNVVINSISVGSVVYGNGTVIVSGTVTSNITDAFAVNYTGCVVVSIKDTDYMSDSVNVNDDGTFRATINLNNALKVDKYDVIVNIAGNNNYTSVNKTFIDNLTVSHANVTINDIRVDSIVYGLDDSVTVVGTITNNIDIGANYTGEIAASIIGHEFITGIVCENGTFVIVIPLEYALDHGDYNITVNVTGNDNYASANKTFENKLKVNKTNVIINDIRVGDVIYWDTYVIVNGSISSNITDGFGVNYTGQIIVSVAGKNINSTTRVNPDGTFTVTLE